MLTAAQAHRQGARTSSYYINIGGQGTGTLTGNNVDPKLVKADELYAYKGSMSRSIHAATVNTLFSSGEIVAGLTYIKVPRSQTSMFVINSFNKGDKIPQITIYRADVINGKITVTEEFIFSNCDILRIEEGFDDGDPNGLYALEGEFRYTQKQDTLYFFDQEGKPLGQNVSLINFPQGTLQAQASGGGGTGTGGGGAAGGGGAKPTPPKPPSPPSGGGGSSGGGGGESI
jgi:hypothetical protein